MANFNTLNPYDLTAEQLKQVRKTLARRLNERMINLEKHGVSVGAIEKYNLLLRDYYDGKTRIPLSTKIKDERKLAVEVDRIQTILQMKTSTYTGIKSQYRKTAKTLKARYGIEFENMEQMQTFFTSEVWKILDKAYGSDNAQRLIGTYEQSPDEVIKSIEDSIQRGSRDILEAMGFNSKADALKRISNAEKLRNSSKTLRERANALKDVIL